MGNLSLTRLLVEYQNAPIGIDCRQPRFSWELVSEEYNVVQEAYELSVESENGYQTTGRIQSSESVLVKFKELKLDPVTEYKVRVTVWDNHGNRAKIESRFETGKMNRPWGAKWVEPEQLPTESTLDNKEWSAHTEHVNSYEERDFHEFRPAQYLRIPFEGEKRIRKMRIYATAHGVYRLTVNGKRPDDREFAPENTSYDKFLQYQTYDVTDMVTKGENVIGVILGDGWWAGRLGFMGDSGQYGGTLGLLLEAVVTYEDGTSVTVTGESAKSSVGPIIFSDIFVGEKYDARKEMTGWDKPGFDDSGWKSVNTVEYNMDNLTGQYGEPVRPVERLKPHALIHTPAGETVLDMGQVIAGQLEFTVEAKEGIRIKLEHSEVLDENGNYYNNIIGINKEQTDYYITKAGKQTYRPVFTYHGFRYIRITGWPGEIDLDAFTAYVLSSDKERTGKFETSDPRINQLQNNIVWSQIANTLAIPTDCPQRERAGWTGDIMAYAPTLCFNEGAGAFLTRWMKNVRIDQQEDGQVPIIVPYLKAYKLFARAVQKSDTSCGWGDAVIQVPWAVYRAYGDRQILEENYDAMTKWMKYIQYRAETSHPDGYEQWDDAHQERSRYLWNTDFHYGDWLIPSVVLGNPDANAMNETAYATMGIVAPAYYAFSARSMAEIAETLGRTEDQKYYHELYKKIRCAFIQEYVHEDGTLDADFQGIYVICLKNGLVDEEIRPKMVSHLRKMIRENGDCLDTGFLSVPFLMDVLCENGCRDIAYQLLYQTRCPSWLYEVEHGATTMWESWGAIGEDGKVSTYSYNHYAFGCVGDWMYRELGGLKAAEAGYKKIEIRPALDCGLAYVHVSQHTPYGKAEVEWKIQDLRTTVSVTIPPNTTAEVYLPGNKVEKIGSGNYCFVC